MSDRPGWNSVLFTVALAAVCAVTGIVVLPLVFGPGPSDLATFVWLLSALVLSVLLIALTSRLSRPLAAELGRGLGSSITPSQTLLLARLLMIGLALVATQAMLRHPVALILGGDSSAVSIESGIAAAALAVLLVLLVWVYQTARPMVQTVTLRAIDAAIPTTGTALVAEPTRTSASVVSSSPVPAPTDAVTVVAPLFARSTIEATTVIASRDADATVDTRRDADATVVAKRTDDQATIVASPADDPTLRVPGA
jgi:hypothetical protein